MKTRMQPVGTAWAKLPRIVRDLAIETGKQIELKMIGAETELDRQILEMIRDPLTHMVRNSADHGIEPREQRRCRGQARDRHDHAQRLPRGRPHHHRDPRRRPRPRRLADPRQDPRTGPGDARGARAAERPAGSPVHLQGRLLHRRDGHQRLGARRRHGRGPQQRRENRRRGRAELGSRQGHDLHHQDSADARHRLGADHRLRRPAFRRPADLRARAGPRLAGRAPPGGDAQQRAGAEPAQPAAAAGVPARPAADRHGLRGRARPRGVLRRRRPDRQPAPRRHRRPGVRHRGDRGQAGGPGVAQDPVLLRDHHPRRRQRHHDPRPQRHRRERRRGAGQRRRTGRGDGRQRKPPLQPHRLPRRRPLAQGRADDAGRAAGEHRRRCRRARRRPRRHPVPRPHDAADQPQPGAARCAATAASRCWSSPSASAPSA